MCFYGDRYLSTSMKVSLERPCFSGIRVQPTTIMIRGRGVIKRSNLFRFVCLFVCLFFFLTNDAPYLERREDLHIL